MPELSVVVNGRTYAIVCGDGQEDHVARLARDIDDRVRQLVGILGQAGEARLLLMASLLISDELADARAQLASGERGTAPPLATDAEPHDAGAYDVEAISQAFAELDTLAERIDAVARRLRCL